MKYLPIFFIVIILASALIFVNYSQKTNIHFDKNKTLNPNEACKILNSIESIKQDFPCPSLSGPEDVNYYKTCFHECPKVQYLNDLYQGFSGGWENGDMTNPLNYIKAEYIHDNNSSFLLNYYEYGGGTCSFSKSKLYGYNCIYSADNITFLYYLGICHDYKTYILHQVSGINVRDAIKPEYISRATFEGNKAVIKDFQKVFGDFPTTTIEVKGFDIEITYGKITCP